MKSCISILTKQVRVVENYSFHKIIVQLYKYRQHFQIHVLLVKYDRDYLLDNYTKYHTELHNVFTVCQPRIFVLSCMGMVDWITFMRRQEEVPERYYI